MRTRLERLTGSLRCVRELLVKAQDQPDERLAIGERHLAAVGCCLQLARAPNDPTPAHFRVTPLVHNKSTCAYGAQGVKNDGISNASQPFGLERHAPRRDRPDRPCATRRIQPNDENREWVVLIGALPTGRGGMKRVRRASSGSERDVTSPGAHPAPMALASDGALILNAAEFTVEGSITAIVGIAGKVGLPIFIGVVLPVRLRKRLLRDIDNAAADLGGRWGGQLTRVHGSAFDPSSEARALRSRGRRAPQARHPRGPRP